MQYFAFVPILKTKRFDNQQHQKNYREKIMKKYRNYVTSLLAVFTVLMTQSCLDDGDDWADSFKDTLLGMGTVQTLDEDDFYFLLDEGSKLYPTDRSEIRNYEVKDGQRAFVYFDELPEELPGYEYNAKVRFIQDILTKDIYSMPAEKADSIGDDPINITQLWTTRQDYLNIECQFYHNNDNNKKHMLSLVVNETATDEAEDPDYITLEFRHNAHQDPAVYPSPAIVSYKLDAIAPLLEGKKGLRIRVRTIYDGVKYLLVKFGDNNAEEPSTPLESTQAY